MTDQTFIWPHQEAQLLAFVKRLPTTNRWKVTIARYRKSRSDAQNRSLWGVAYKTLSDATGNNPEDLHTFFCGEYFGWKEVEVMGQVKRKPVRTTTTDENSKRSVIPTVEFMGFYEFIQQRSAETVGVYVPDPGENDYDQAA